MEKVEFSVKMDLEEESDSPAVGLLVENIIQSCFANFLFLDLQSAIEF